MQKLVFRKEAPQLQGFAKRPMWLEYRKQEGGYYEQSREGDLGAKPCA